MKFELCAGYEEQKWDGIVVPVLEGTLDHLQLPCEAEFQAVRNQAVFSGKRGEVYRFTALRTGRMIQYFLLGLGKSVSLETMLHSCAAVYRQCHDMRLSRVLTDLRGLETLTPDLLKKSAEAMYLSGYHFDKYKFEPDPDGVQEAAFCCDVQEGYQRALNEAVVCGKAACMARDLINEPPTVMTPEKLAEAAGEILAGTPVQVTIYGREQIRKLGLTAFLEVGKGSIQEPKLIVMKYDGDPAHPESRLGLIGKGLTYDSGGYSLQSSEFMETMQHDMSGGAAVICALWAAQSRGLELNVTGIVAACENKLSATAYVPGDVIRSMSGRYIEVNNTDAEGRITLADAVTYAKQCCGVDSIIDIATLTDGIQTALGDERCGLFTNDHGLSAYVEKGAAAACARVWELPCDENLRRVLDSRVAHLKNSAMGSSVGGYATVGAMFVKEFAEDTPWVHLDIGGTAWSRKCEGIYTKGGIGFGTRMLYETMCEMEKR